VSSSDPLSSSEQPHIRAVHPMGKRLWLHIPMTYDYAGLGWGAFLYIREILEHHGVTADQLRHRYTEESYSQMVAVFEVVGHVRH
jgi:hypothetical protein